MLALPLPGARRAAPSAAGRRADHGDAVGRTGAPPRPRAAFVAGIKVDAVPATLAALAGRYVQHGGGAIGGAACATITRALERADDAWW